MRSPPSRVVPGQVASVCEAPGQANGSNKSASSERIAGVLDLLAQPEGTHVWMTCLDLPARQLRECAAVLSVDERHRAERFCLERDRDRFIAGRGLLRTLVSRYLGQRPERLRFRYGADGKPELAGETGPGGLRFNCSHSCGLALYVLARGRRVGVDLERIRPVAEAESIARSCFAEREIALWRALPIPARQMAFFRCWTRKEAYLKAVGCGLSLPPDRVTVSFAPGKRPRLLSVDGDPSEIPRWVLCELVPAEGWIGAVVVERRPSHPRAAG